MPRGHLPRRRLESMSRFTHKPGSVWSIQHHNIYLIVSTVSQDPIFYSSSDYLPMNSFRKTSDSNAALPAFGRPPTVSATRVMSY